MLFRRNNLHTILFQNVLVVRAVVTVAGKAVEFPYKDNLKQLFCAVLDHVLELRSICRFCR